MKVILHIELIKRRFLACKNREHKKSMFNLINHLSRDTKTEHFTVCFVLRNENIENDLLFKKSEEVFDEKRLIYVTTF